MTYRAELSERALGQLSGFPAKALDALVATMSMVADYQTIRFGPSPPMTRTSGAPSSAARAWSPT